jgi:hypothetical protein
MRAILNALGRKRTLITGFSLLSLLTVMSLAQKPAARITTEIDNSERVTIPGTHSPMARAENDAGRVPSETELKGINIVFSRTAPQEADLQALIAAQQNPASPLYHKWLSPDDFAARFGVADSDIAKVELWLEQQGFSVDGAARSKNRITFSGTVEQVEAAFGTELHYYSTKGETHFAPFGDLSVPAALSSLVKTVTNVSSFRPRPHVTIRPPQPATRTNFTSSQTGEHYLTPKDVATIYDINRAYNAGYTGADQSIAVVGQSAIELSDIEKFQRAAGLIVKDPTLVLVPDSGSAAFRSGDEAESDLDVEYSGGIATGATVYLVYVGSTPTYNIWDSVVYSVDNKIAPIISITYGYCETALSLSDHSTMNDTLAQAASQGQSVVAAAGDHGSTGCYGEMGLTVSEQEALAVSFPASSEYATAMGGTEFPAADVASSNTTYWKSANGSDLISSALSYVPEQVWNDDSVTKGLASGGGGVSTLTARPSWQAGVTGIPSGSYRLVPDISLDSSVINAGYLFCSSDPSLGIAGSCSNGFRDENDDHLTVAGGTSFAAPIFAGMLAIINGKLDSAGLGVVNSTLYTLAGDSTTYASAFHDITSGSNECTAGPNYCSLAGESEYPATTGYDEASGLGSVDFYNLLTAWPASARSEVASETVLSAATTTPAPGANDTVTITVASDSSASATTPTGTLTIVVDGTTVISSLALSNGSATYSFSSTSLGPHVITATYSGDSTYASSSGTLTVTVTPRTFTLAASNVTVSAGSSGTSIITITPKNGYTGTVGWSISSSPSLTNGCFSLPNATVSSTSAITATMTVYTNSSACSSVSLIGLSASRGFVGTLLSAYGNALRPLSPLNKGQTCVALAGLLFFGLMGCLRRKLRVLAGVFLLATACFAVSGCGGGGGGSGSGSPSLSTSNAAKGTYTVTILGTDTSSASITASTTMTLTID